MHHEKSSGLPHWRPVAPRLKKKPAYALSDLLRFDDTDFIEVAYRTLLGRPSDSGRDGYLAALRGGRVSKVEVLGLMRFSEEGRRHAVHIDGLLLPYKLHQWRHRRGIGPILGFAMAVLRLPKLAWRLQSMEANAAHEAQHVGEALNRLSLDVEQRLAGMENALRTTIDTVVERSFVELEQSFIGARAAHTCVLDPDVQSLPDDESNARSQRYMPVVEPVAFKRAMVGEIVRQRGGEEVELSSLVPQAQLTVKTASRVNAAASAIADAIDRFGMDLATRAAATEYALQSRLDQISTEWHKKLAARAAALRSIEGRVDEQRASQEDDREQARRSIDRLAQDQLATRRNVLHVQMCLDRISSASQQDSATPKAAAPGTSGVDVHALDAFYIEFENEFRGSRELVAKRAEVYLPIISTALADSGGGTTLDLGCGRGEWLELLREHNVEARGVELNEVNVVECRARGLDVQQAEAVAYLRTLGEAVLGAVTGMHIVEHMPFPALVALFDEIRRVLKPGGVVIFETPNPENLAVSTRDFYLDPTHRHPLPPPLLEYTAKSRGFEQVEIRRLIEHRPIPILPAVEEPGQPNAGVIEWLLQQSRELLCAAPDYAVVARKGPANPSLRSDLGPGTGATERA